MEPMQGSSVQVGSAQTYVSGTAPTIALERKPGVRTELDGQHDLIAQLGDAVGRLTERLSMATLAYPTAPQEDLPERPLCPLGDEIARNNRLLRECLIAVEQLRESIDL